MVGGGGEGSQSSFGVCVRRPQADSTVDTCAERAVARAFVRVEFEGCTSTPMTPEPTRIKASTLIATACMAISTSAAKA